MKKLLMGLLVMLLLTVSVKANDNLGFDDKDGSLYYSAESKDNVFLTYEEMTPGKVHSDTLRVKNESPNTYDLYLRINSVSQSFLKEELIENLVMKIYSDGKLVYDGEAKAMEYDDNGVAFYRLIELGNFEPNEVKEVVVELKITEEYANDDNLETGEIAWQFFAGYEDGVMPDPPVPNGEISMRTVLLSLVALFSTLIFTLLYRTKAGINKKKRKKKKIEGD